MIAVTSDGICARDTSRAREWFRRPSYNPYPMARSEPIKAVRGVRDILPRDRPLWRAAERAAAEVAMRFGYQEIVTPIIEHVELIERVGEDTDAVSKELYRFEDRGGRKLALRPYLVGPMFRYDRPQKGRYRQFYQLDVEAIGSASPALDAEVIEIAAGWLHESGISALALQLNSIGDDVCRPAYLERLKDYYRPLKSRLHADSQLRLERNPLRLLDSKFAQDQPFKVDAPRITDHLCEPCADAWAHVRRLIDAAGIEYVHNPYLVRGLDYYTRTVFEFYPAG